MANKIMKSTIASVLAIMSVAASVPGTAIGNVIADTAITASANVVSGSFATEELPDGTLCITKFEGTGSVIEIPVKLNGKTVTKIGDKAFMGNEYVTEIYFSNYITSVGEFAFCNCTALKSVYCSNSVKTIGRGAFSNCTSLIEILNLGGLEAIEEGTFQRCTSLEAFHIPGRVKYIGTGAFQECTNLKEISFHGTTIGKKAFYKCENLSTIDMNDVVDIEDYAFFGCTSLSEIYPAEVKTIGNSAFGSCTALTDLHLMSHGHELTSIGNDAFANCKNLETVYLPENLTTLGKRAFTNCHALKGVGIFSEKLTTIPMGAFATTGITTIAIPEGVTSIDGAAFNSCKSLEYIELPSTLKTIGAKAFDNTGVKNVTYNSHEAQWNTLEIGEGNDVLASAEKLFSVAPANIPVSYERNGNDITFTWSPVDGVEKYGIVGYYYDNFYHTSSGDWALKAETTGTSYTMKNLKPDTNYHFAIVPMVNGKWNENISNNVIKFTTEPKVFTYPSLRTIEYNEPTHQFRVIWTPVEGAQAYGIAYYAAGKWRVATQTIPGSTTTFTSPKLTAGSTHKVVIAAKVNGKWDTSNLSKRAFTVTVK
jgi:hypothetical protein